MSIRAMDWARQQRTGNPTLKAVLRAVADYADDQGYSWPSQLTLADDTELSERAVREALKLLEGMGLLTRIPWRRPDNSRATDTIKLRLDAEEAGNGKATGVPAGRSGNPAPVPAVDAGTTHLPANGAATPTGTKFRHPYRQEVPGVPAGGAGLTTFEPPGNHQGVSASAESGRAGSTEGGFSEMDWQVSLERLVASGSNRELAKRFLGKTLRLLRGRAGELAKAVADVCDDDDPKPFDAVLAKLKIVEPARRFQRKGMNDKLRHHDWPTDFRETFWSAFPRKDDKLKTMKVLEFIHREDKIAFEAIMSGVARLKASGIEKKYVAYGHRWLRDERWTDEMACQTSAKPARNGTADFWAGDAIKADDQIRGGRNDERSGGGDESEWHRPGEPGHGGSDERSAQSPAAGADARQLPPLRLVGRV